MNKLNNNVNLLSNENRDILQNYINNNQTIDRSNIEEFFNFEFVTPELIGYVGW